MQFLRGFSSTIYNKKAVSVCEKFTEIAIWHLLEAMAPVGENSRQGEQAVYLAFSYRHYSLPYHDFTFSYSLLPDRLIFYGRYLPAFCLIS
jgi:hypothetical protein